MLLVQVAGALTAAIFVLNVALHRPVIDALLFSLAIAVGIPGTTRPSRRRSAPISACRRGGWPPAPTSTGRAIGWPA